MSNGSRRRASQQANLMGQAGSGMFRSMLQMSEAAIAAQSVIAHRMGLLHDAASGSGRDDHPEFSRMGLEKVEATVLAGPAILNGFVKTQAELVRIWQEETIAASGVATRLLASGSPAQAAGVMSASATSAAERSITAGLKLMIMSNRAMTAIFAPYRTRIRGNARRLGRNGRR